MAFCAGVPLILAEALLKVATQADLETVLPLADTAGRLIVSQQQHLVTQGISRSTLEATSGNPADRDRAPRPSLSRYLRPL